MPFQRPRRWTLADLANSSVNTWTGWCRWMPLNGWFFNALASLISLLIICSYNFGVHQLNSWGAAKCWEKLRSAEGLAWFDTFVSWPNLRFHCRDCFTPRWPCTSSLMVGLWTWSWAASSSAMQLLCLSVAQWTQLARPQSYALPTFFYTTLPSPQKQLKTSC